MSRWTPCRSAPGSSRAPRRKTAARAPALAALVKAHHPARPPSRRWVPLSFPRLLRDRAVTLWLWPPRLPGSDARRSCGRGRGRVCGDGLRHRPGTRTRGRPGSVDVPDFLRDQLRIDAPPASRQHAAVAALYALRGHGCERLPPALLTRISGEGTVGGGRQGAARRTGGAPNWKEPTSCPTWPAAPARRGGGGAPEAGHFRGYRAQGARVGAALHPVRPAQPRAALRDKPDKPNGQDIPLRTRSCTSCSEPMEAVMPDYPCPYQSR